MAVYVYGLTSADVTAVLPVIDGATFGASSVPVSTTDITQFIEDGAAQLNSAVLDRSGITPDANLDEDTHAALKQLVRSFAVAQCAHLLGMGATYERAHKYWQDGYTQYLSAPRTLGSAYGDTFSVDIDLIESPSSINDPAYDDFSFIGNDKIW